MGDRPTAQINSGDGFPETIWSAATPVQTSAPGRMDELGEMVMEFTRPQNHGVYDRRVSSGHVAQMRPAYFRFVSYGEQTMKLEIDVTEADVEFLSKWASVSRTLSTARRVCEDVAAGDAPDADQAEIASMELDDLTPVIDRLHQSVRNQIWTVLGQK